MQQVTDGTFKTEVLDYKGVVLVDFWAEWCPPCKALSPIISELAEDYNDKVKVLKMDTDSNPQTAMSYNINSIPTVIIFKDGKVVDTMVGLRQKIDYMSKLNNLINS